ncbi:phage portal protein [Dactylosporangium sp. CA-139066]|uniref:phage portal protein n=1 Tax=Dactylosporangium sp. CA-139066 TaxID=3239930 RepID=UPI003D8F3071
MSVEALGVLLNFRAEEKDRLDYVRRYVKGDHDLPYMPKGARQEYKGIVAKSVANWLPLIPTVIAQNLFLEGYRNPEDVGEDGSKSVAQWAWEVWTANGMEARQSAVHRGALTYGVHYAIVLPGEPVPVIRPASALNMTAVYDGEDDEWPIFAAKFSRAYANGKMVRRVELYDDTEIITYHGPTSDTRDASAFTEVKRESHGMGVCPVVRFRNEWEDSEDEPIRGEVEPYIPIQDRLNETTLGLLMAQNYSAFIQKWVTGLAIPEDTNEFLSDGTTPNPNFGKPIEPFQSAVDRLFFSEDPETKFGNFDQTDLSGFLASLEAGIKHLSAIAQIPPHYLLGAIANLSAEALAAAETGLTRKVGERKSLFGVSWAQVLRLVCIAAGKAADTSAVVLWRDAEARSLASTVDAFGKLAQMLDVPKEALWERIPGVTMADVIAWRALKEKQAEADPMAQLANKLAQQGAELATTPAQPANGAPDGGNA